MIWSSVGTISLKSDWQFTEPVEGDFFRLKHSGAPLSGLFSIAQAQIGEGSIDLIDSQTFESSNQPEILRLPTPECFEKGKRKIAVKRIPKGISLEDELRRLLNSRLFISQGSSFNFSRSTWNLQIEVSDMPLNIFLTPITTGSSNVFKTCTTSTFNAPISPTDGGGATSARALDQNVNRKYVLIVNRGDKDVALTLLTNPGASWASPPWEFAKGIPLKAGGGSFEITSSNLYQGAIYAVTAGGGTSTISITECVE